MANYLYVDNSNVWIEGKHVSAVQNRIAPDIFTAQQKNICDPNFSIDFGRLFEFAGGKKDDVGRAILFGSRPPQNDSLWAIARSRGFEVIVYDRNIANKEKKIDGSIITEMITDSYERMKAGQDEFTLVAGDSDYVPTIERLKERGFAFHVVFWRHASAELRRVATQFIPIDEYLDYLRLK